MKKWITAVIMALLIIGIYIQLNMYSHKTTRLGSYLLTISQNKYTGEIVKKEVIDSVGNRKIHWDYRWFVYLRYFVFNYDGKRPPYPVYP